MRSLRASNGALRCQRLFIALLFLGTQLATSIAASGLFVQTAAAAPICVVDTAGANDEPGQKDLTKLCVDYAGVPTTIQTKWNWDERGTTGANTMDACSLFDTDGDGKINYAVCVTTKNTPATFYALTTYSCGDDKIDRCTSPVNAIPNGTTSCSVSQQNTDPFTAGTSYPADTEGLCTIQLSAVGGASAKLVDVCSYPSAQPNSDPSDCVIARNDYGKVELIKDIVPNGNPGKFNLSINGPETNDTTTVSNVGDNGTTGEVVVKKGTVVVSESAGTSTSLSNYTTSISCRDLNGTGAVIATGTPTGTSTRQLSFTLAEDADVVCTITNTAQASITIIKDAQPNSSQDFGFTTTGTGLSSFSLDDDSDATLSNTKSFNGLAAGNYSVTETATAGWDLSSIDCGYATNAVVNGPTVSIALTAGQNVTCQYTNQKRGTITVNKVTVPANDPTSFSVTASGTGDIAGSATRTVSTAQSVTYDVAPGTYGVAEDLVNTPGWTMTSNTCTGLTIDASNLSRSCTITNTKLARLKIVKDAQPNSSQDFGFTTTGTGLSSFSLDDDSDATLPNNQQFTNLLPGNFTVTEGAVNGWDLTNLTCTGTTAFSRNGQTLNVALVAGDDVTCTFTNTGRGAIFGTKFEANADSTTVGTLANWTINLLSGTTVVATTTTDTSGNYAFQNVTPGDYSVAEVLQAGYTQIFYPSPFTVSAGEQETQKDFGNFHNGTISGYKWNDQNGNGQYDNEPKLSGWTIFIDSTPNAVLDNNETSTTTNAQGAYSFSDLAPGTYRICEVQQTGWTQTYPANNACHTIVIDLSGEAATAHFGNQGRGTIQVIKNVDTDGDGDIDTYGANDWTWDIDGSGNFATGSSRAIAAGSYTVSEDQKTNYHVTASSCTGETNGTASESVRVSVAPGETVVCTFTNTRDTGFITVNKSVDPSSDSGVFNLLINDTAYASNVGDGGTTGQIRVPTGTYTVSETAGSSTDLDAYATANECVWSQYRGGQGDGAIVSGITVSAGDDVVCTFTNTRLATITVIKDAVPNDAQDFDFTIAGEQMYQDVLYEDEEFMPYSFYDTFTLDDDTDATLPKSHTVAYLLPGTYFIAEDAVANWELSNVSCGEDVAFEQQDTTIAVTVGAGQHLTCIFTNTRDTGTITVQKILTPSTNTGKFNLLINGVTYAANVGNGGTTSALSLPTGSYTVSETAGSSTTLSDYESAYRCTSGDRVITAGSGTSSAAFSLRKGEHIVCTFTNNKGEILAISTPPPAAAPNLVNTGTHTWIATGSGLALLSIVGALALSTRRRLAATSARK